MSTSTPTAMSLWRLERLRLTRSPRALVLCGVYVFFGLLSPVLARYMSELTRYLATSVTIVAPPPQNRDGIVSYVGQTSQTGLIVVVVVAAGAMAFDSRRGLATFYRTRTAGIGALLWPRYVVCALASVAANLLGTAACWYGTALLLGTLPAGAVFEGILCASVYLAFAVAVVALAASYARSALGTIGVSLVILLALPLLGISGALHPWLPSTLVQAPVELLGVAGIGSFVRSLTVTIVAVPLLLLAAARRLARREL